MARVAEVSDIGLGTDILVPTFLTLGRDTLQGRGIESEGTEIHLGGVDGVAAHRFEHPSASGVLFETACRGVVLGLAVEHVGEEGSARSWEGWVQLELASEGSSRNAGNTIGIVASSSGAGVREGPLELSHGDGTIALAGDVAHVCGRRRSSTGRNRRGRTARLRDFDNVIIATATGGSLVRRVLVMFMMGSDSKAAVGPAVVGSRSLTHLVAWATELVISLGSVNEHADYGGGRLRE